MTMRMEGGRGGGREEESYFLFVWKGKKKREKVRIIVIKLAKKKEKSFYLQCVSALGFLLAFVSCREIFFIRARWLVDGLLPSREKDKQK